MESIEPLKELEGSDVVETPEETPKRVEQPTDPSNLPEDGQDKIQLFDPTTSSDVPGEVELSTTTTSPDLTENQVQKHKKRRRSAESRLSRSSITSNKLKNLKLLVDRAVEHNKTFAILGKFPSIRDALKARGWVQNYEALTQHRTTSSVSNNHARLSANKDVEASSVSTLISPTEQSCDSPIISNDDQDAQLISRLLRDAPVNFIWAMGDYIDWKYISKLTVVSRFPRVYFTTKVGLCNYLQQTHWFCEAGISNTLFPRCYNIATDEDLSAFVNDFRLTACLSTLQIVISAVDSDKKDIYSDEGKVPLAAVEFAARRCSEYVSVQEHEDIDIKETEHIWDHQWDQFLTWYYHLAHENAGFMIATDSQKKALYMCSKITVESMRSHWPQLHLDGLNNLWIIKPGAKSRGRGIQVMRKLEDIISRVGTLHSKDPRYVIQKYIERPFLIYNTKFDIRQWFLVTSAYPLTIWMYKESYLRFCSQLFSLSNMHESVHLSNNAVQCKYKNARRDQALPDENMWDCYTFQTYLRAMGQAEMWDTVIYPGMKESITGTLLAAQEHMEHRKNCFELYGADFMLTEDLVPWLIEINSSPCMSPTTSVTARMCAQCLEDVIKVVIDRKHNKHADTGMFEMVYKQHISPPQPYMGMNLTVRGTKIQKSPKTKRKIRPPPNCDNQFNLNTVKGVKGFIEDLSTQLKTNIIEEQKPECSEEESSYSSSSSSTDDETTSDEDSEVVLCATKTSSIPIPEPKTPIQSEETSKEETTLDLQPTVCPIVRPDLKGSNETSESNEATTKDDKTVDKSIRGHIIRFKTQERSVQRLLKGEPTRLYKTDNLKCWKKNMESAQNNELLNDWKQRIDRTRANCEEMLTKLKILKDTDLNKKIRKVRGIDWKAENGTVQEIVKKLAQPQKKEFLERLPIVRDSVLRKSVMDKKDSPRSGKDSLSSACSSQSILPQIKSQRKIAPTNNNLFAVGMRLNCPSSSYSPREKLILPMGSEQCLGLSLTTITNALASS